MKKLNYQTLEEQGYDGYLLNEAPERILQFGEGNFLRGFVEDFVDQMNEKAGFHTKVVACQPSSQSPAGSDRINSQEGLYTLLIRGYENGTAVEKKRVISCISRCLNLYRDYDAWMDCAKNPDLRFITCNTTEAGIVYDPSCQFTDKPAASYPGKLTQFLYKRFQEFGQVSGKGFIILACELIDDNGKALKNCVLHYAKQWNLGTEFENWIETENLFCSTLVDRIVTGYPHNEAEKLCKTFGYEDQLIDTGEVYSIWVIEGPDWLKKELPFEEAGLPVLICDDHKPYKQRKVRILNGAHTSMVPGAYLAGQDIVRDCMNDSVIEGFMSKTLQDEIIPTLALPKEELLEFAGAVKERFQNPFIDHALLSICLNCTSKWKARVLPSFKAYLEQTGELPKCLTASFAFYIALYRSGQLTEKGLLCHRGQEEYLLNDDAAVLKFYDEHSQDSSEALAHAVCSNIDFWGEDLSLIPGFETSITELLEAIKNHGTYEVMNNCLAS